MSAKFIGQYLLEKGLITREALLAATEHQQRVNLTLGGLAFAQGLLSEAQAEAINLEQQRSDKRFGEIALEKNLLNMQQLDELLRVQKEKRVFLGEILIQQGHISHERFDSELALFKQEQERSAELVLVDLHSLPQREVIEDFLDMTLKILLRVAKEQVKITSVSNTEKKFPYTIAQRINGGKQFDYAMSLPENLLLVLCEHFLKVKCTVVNELALDAASEVLNIITGNGCAKLSVRGLKVTLEPPRVINAPVTDYAVCVGMSSVAADFEVRFYF
ncbi:MAG: chemotaxis protein CheX [Gallionella sp.]